MYILCIGYGFCLRRTQYGMGLEASGGRRANVRPTLNGCGDFFFHEQNICCIGNRSLFVDLVANFFLTVR